VWIFRWIEVKALPFHQSSVAVFVTILLACASSDFSSWDVGWPCILGLYGGWPCIHGVLQNDVVHKTSSLSMPAAFTLTTYAILFYFSFHRTCFAQETRLKPAAAKS
jgi:hypothetical protein